ncbi:MAG: winged helix-turn-helix transcriptional regulator [Dehalococcoidales bacterium]
MSEWKFLTNHAIVLSYVSIHPRITARDLSGAIGITERATRKIIADLLQAGYISKELEGRRNRYNVNPNLPLHNVGLEETAVGYLLEILGWRKRWRPRKTK